MAQGIGREVDSEAYGVRSCSLELWLQRWNEGRRREAALGTVPPNPGLSSLQSSSPCI
jgi:hypothetical protein